MAGKPPYFPFYVRDFASDGKVEAMDTTEVGAYILLLCKAWLEEPPGSIPADDAILARWARLDADTWSKCRARVLGPFTLNATDNRYYQKRMQEEFRKLMCLYRSRSAGGRKGAKSRWQKGDCDKKNDSAIGSPIGTPNGKNMAPGSVSISSSSSETDKDTSLSPGEGGAGEGESHGSVITQPSASKQVYRSSLPCDNPGLAAIAERVVVHYQSTVKPASHKGGGVQAVIQQLQRGISEDALLRAALGYEHFCRQNNRAAQFREAVKNFYGPSNGCDEYLDFTPTTPKDEQRQRFERQQKQLESLKPQGKTVPLGDVVRRAKQNQQRKVNDDPTSGS